MLRISSCTQDFSNNPICRMFICERCRQQSFVCSGCDRGQWYCGRECALQARRRNQREARRRYQSTDRGRRMHAERSRQYRARARCVTDQGLPLEPPSTQKPISVSSTTSAAKPNTTHDARPAIVCHFCGRSRSAFVRRDPIRRPRKRTVDARSSLKARIRRV